MRKITQLLSVFLLPAMVFAGLQTQPVEYKDGGVALEGYLAFKKDVSGQQPGVLVVPDWMGVREPFKAIADRLAQMGYIAFVADIYGKGVQPSNSQEASAEAQKYKSDRKLLRQRVLAGFE